ncbi:MAG: hypothetical protein KJN72_12240 [Woeseia sp.]|nr:hypothetical protein [Woeseia sp.]
MKTVISAHSNHQYGDYLATMHLPDQSVFITDVDLWPIYLENFADPDDRQYHNCHACRQFIQRFGNLATIEPDGSIKSAVWRLDDAPEAYRKAIYNMKSAVESAQVSGVFLSKEELLGTPVTGVWTHYAVQNPRVYRHSLMDEGQAMAAKKEDYRNISRALSEFDLDLLDQVCELLKTDALYRSEKIMGQAEWLRDLKRDTAATKHQRRRKNIVWRAIADAPDGFCHPRSGMIGTLLDDLSAGLAFDDAARKFAAKMHPLQYQRPQAAPTAGAILVAEKAVKALGVERSLERRYATLSDMQTIWTPPDVPVEKSSGIFSHLKETARQPIAAVGGPITWIKFADEALPNARKIEVKISSRRMGFAVFLAAVDKDSPVIFQWGNPVSWYVWHEGAYASQLSLAAGWVSCDAISLMPYMWDEENLTNFDKNPVFILHGARESRQAGSAIFPESLKPEFHSIRSVIEAHSRKSEIHQIDESHVVGLGIGATVRVHTSIITEYLIDRWS